MSKYSDDVIEALNKSQNKDTAISLIAKHGDDAANIIMDYSDNGLTALKNGITPKQINESTRQIKLVFHKKGNWCIIKTKQIHRAN